MEPLSSESNVSPQTDSLLDDVLDTSMFDKKVKQAQNVLFIIAVVQLVWGIIRLLGSKGPEWGIEITVNIVIAGLFVGLALWCKFKPVAAIVAALVLYAGLFALDVWADSSAIYKGIIFKIIIVIYLVKGLGAAREAQRIKNFGK